MVCSYKRTCRCDIIIIFGGVNVESIGFPVDPVFALEVKLLGNIVDVYLGLTAYKCVEAPRGSAVVNCNSRILIVINNGKGILMPNLGDIPVRGSWGNSVLQLLPGVVSLGLEQGPRAVA